MSYVDALADALDSVVIRGRRKARILAEISDHLRCDPNADLGSPDELARGFADTLGTALALRAAVLAFAALAIAGALFAVAFLAHPGVLRSSTDTARPFSDLAAAMIVIGPQVAFVAGSLGALRALRRRRAPVIARAESAIIVRRAATGVAAGGVSMAGLALMAVILGDRAPGGWTALTLALSGAAAVALLATAPSLVAATRLRPLHQGTAGGLDADLGVLVPPPLRGHSWRLAIVVAAAVALVITFAGVVQSDPFDGALRGLTDGGACLVGYFALGRFLGLRS